MKPSVPRYSTRQGFSLIELAMVIAVVAILSAFSMVSFGGLNEDRDAQMVMAAQSTLQSIVTQGATRLDMRPADFKDDQYKMVLTAARASIGQKNSNMGDVRLEHSGANFTLTIPSSGRSASYLVADNGTVRLVSIGKFSPDKYKIDQNAGILYKP